VVSAFLRRASAQGDFGTVLHKGDPTSGAILLCTLIRGTNPIVFERFASMDGQSGWQKAMAGDAPSQTQVDDYLKRRTDRDPDLWLIELDTADQERLTLLMAD
jgi:hypothetical protein